MSLLSMVTTCSRVQLCVQGASTFPVPLQSCEAEEAAQLFCCTPGAFRWLQLAEQGDVCVPKVRAGGELSTDCHCSSEDPSENSGCGADKTSTCLRVAVHTPLTDPSLWNHQDNLPASVSEV